MKRPVLWVSIAFLIGVIYCLLFTEKSVNHLFILGIACLVIIGFIAVLFCLFFLKMRKRIWLYCIVFLTFLFFGVFYTYQYQILENKTLNWLLTQDNIIGYVTDSNSNGFCLKISSPYKGKYSCKIWSKEDLTYANGSIVRVYGENLRINEPENPGEFNYKTYNRAKGILTECNADQIEILSKPSKLYDLSNHLRKWIKHMIYCAFNKESAGVIMAILLGDKSGVSEEFLADIQKLSGSHVFSVSGMHFSILSGMLMLFIERVFRKKYAALFGIPFLLIWGIIVGFPISCIRAFVLYVFASIARAVGRPRDGLTGLCLIADLCMLVRPIQLLDAGTQFSFLAVVCFLVFIPCWNPNPHQENTNSSQNRKKDRFKKIIHALTSAIKVSLLIQVCMLPLSLYRYWLFSPYSILFNFVLVTVLPILFISGIVVIGLASLSMEIANYVVIPIEWVIGRILPFAKFLLKLPLSVIITGQPEIWGILIFVIVLSVLSFQCYREGFHIVRLTILLLAIGLLFRVKNPEPLVTFLSVGQGACTVIQEGENVCVIDCGSSSKDGIGEKILTDYLHYYGYNDIDLLILTHLDDDHRNGADELIQQKFPIGKILFAEYADSGGEKWLEECKYRGKFETVLAGDTYGNIEQRNKRQSQWNRILRTHTMNIRIVWPINTPATSQNNSSLGILVELNNRKLLFCGDTDSEGLLGMAKECGEIDILSVPHHGSRFSVSDEAYRILSPQVAVLSCGKNNSYGHPHEEALNILKNSGAKIYRTDIDGAITFSP